MRVSRRSLPRRRRSYTVSSHLVNLLERPLHVLDQRRSLMLALQDDLKPEAHRRANRQYGEN